MKRTDKVGVIVRHYTKHKKGVSDNYFGRVFDQISSLDDDLLDFVYGMIKQVKSKSNE